MKPFQVLAKCFSSYQNFVLRGLNKVIYANLFDLYYIDKVQSFLNTNLNIQWIGSKIGQSVIIIMSISTFIFSTPMLILYVQIYIAYLYIYIYSGFEFVQLWPKLTIAKVLCRMFQKRVNGNLNNPYSSRQARETFVKRQVQY